MGTITEEIRIELDQRELLEWNAPGEYELACEAGELWITFDGRPEDIILRPGERLTVSGGDNAAISALRPARLSLAARGSRRPLRLFAPAEAAARLDRRLRWKFPALALLPAIRLR